MTDASCINAAEALHIDPAERGERARNLEGRPAISDAPVDPPGSDSADDSGQGRAMFVIFVGAVLIVTGAVALLALVDSWWMLGVAFAIHVAMTVVVVLTIVRTMTGQTRARADREQPSPAENARPQPKAGRRTAPRHVDPSRVGELPTESGPARQRVLMVTDENLAAANEVPEAIRPLVDQAEVYVVAPTLTTRLQSLTGDVDGARASAQARLQTVFDHMHANGLEPRGVVGDEDQVTAIADALADFDADVMVLRLHAKGSENENWREHGLAKRARARFTVPTIAFFFDRDGHAVGREEGEARDPHLASRRRDSQPTLSTAG